MVMIMLIYPICVRYGTLLFFAFRFSIVFLFWNSNVDILLEKDDHDGKEKRAWGNLMKVQRWLQHNEQTQRTVVWDEREQEWTGERSQVLKEAMSFGFGEVIHKWEMDWIVEVTSIRLHFLLPMINLVLSFQIARMDTRRTASRTWRVAAGTKPKISSERISSQSHRARESILHHLATTAHTFRAKEHQNSAWSTSSEAQDHSGQVMDWTGIPRIANCCIDGRKCRWARHTDKLTFLGRNLHQIAG